ncbi:MAG TPA: hypothetical protein VNB22_14425 [Pyrinomonadaceae bacterium]|nr:hypothetical protein [Pyrinomonadaceae bacterium]
MIKELFEKHRALMIAGAVSLVCFVVLAVLSLFDSTEILGINRWIKPMKFFVSIAVYAWTVAIYLNFLNGYKKSARVISWGTILIFLIEMIIIVTQAARGTTSHFNLRTPLDGMLFSIMGLSIVFNTILAVYLLYLYFKAEIDLPKAIVWGMRLGLILFLASSFEGGYMSTQMGHAVGVADGGAGLPVVNWSTKGGDLRAAHFIGMHAFQAVPFFAYTLEKYKVRSTTAGTFVFAAVYFAIFTAVFVQALLGKPLLAF